MNILTNFVTSVNCKTDLGVFLDTIPFLGDAASSRVAQGVRRSATDIRSYRTESKNRERARKANGK